MTALKSPFAGDMSRPDAEALAVVLRALANPARLQIVSLLATRTSLVGADLIEPLGLTQPTVSHHLRILADAGLIRWEKRGVYVVNWLDRAAFGELVRLLTPGRGQ